MSARLVERDRQQQSTATASDAWSAVGPSIALSDELWATSATLVESRLADCLGTVE